MTTKLLVILLALGSSTSSAQSHQNFLDNFEHTDNGHHKEDFNNNLGGDLAFNFKQGDDERNPLLLIGEGEYVDYEEIPEHERKHIQHLPPQQRPPHKYGRRPNRPRPAKPHQPPRPQNEEFNLDSGDYEYEFVEHKPDEKPKGFNRPIRHSPPVHGFQDFKSHFPGSSVHGDDDDYVDPYAAIHVAHHDSGYSTPVLPPSKNTYQDPPHSESPHHGFNNFKPLNAIRSVFGGIPGLPGHNEAFSHEVVDVPKNIPHFPKEQFDLHHESGYKHHQPEPHHGGYEHDIKHQGFDIHHGGFEHKPLKKPHHGGGFEHDFKHESFDVHHHGGYEHKPHKPHHGGGYKHKPHKPHHGGYHDHKPHHGYKPHKPKHHQPYYLHVRYGGYDPHHGVKHVSYGYGSPHGGHDHGGYHEDVHHEIGVHDDHHHEQTAGGFSFPGGSFGSAAGFSGDF